MRICISVPSYKDSIAIAEAARKAPRFIGTVGPDLGQLLRVLKSLGKPTRCSWCTSSGHAGTGWRGSFARLAYVCEVVAPGNTPGVQ